MSDLEKNQKSPESIELVSQKIENLVKKGDYFDIREKIPELKEMSIAMGWDRKAFDENSIDVDLSCFLVNKMEQTREDMDFIFYNNPKANNGAVRHQGDSRGGDGDGDDEIITLDINGLHFDIIKIAFVLSIYDAEERANHFGQVRNMYVRMVNIADKSEVFRYKINEEDFQGQTAIKVGELVREGPKWYFNVIGEPIPGGLAQIATQYGIIIANQ